MLLLVSNFYLTAASSKSGVPWSLPQHSKRVMLVDRLVVLKTVIVNSLEGLDHSPAVEV